jgi:AsmA-like protein
VRRAWKWVAVVVAAVVVLAIAFLAAVPYLVDTPRIQAVIASSATQALGRPVKFSAVSLSVLPWPSVVLENLEVAEDPAFGTAPFLRLNRAQVRLRLLPLLLLRVELGDFVLQEPAIALIKRADGRWNISSLGPTGEEARGPARPRSGGGGGSGAAAVLGSRIKIEKGVVAYESRADGRLSRYRVEDLDLVLTPSAGPLAFEGDARVKPGDLEVKIAEGTVGLNGAPALTAAPVRGRISLEGKDIKELMASVLGPEPAVAGGLKGTLTLAGTVGKPRASGDVQVSNLTLTQVNPRCGEPKRRTLTLGPLKLNTAWEEPRLTARPVTTTIANGIVTTNLTATLDGGVRVELGDLGIKALPVEKILVDFLCQGYAVTGPLDLTGRASARLPQLWTTLNGAGQIRLGPGKIVGAQALALLNNVVRLAGAVESLLSGEVPTWLTSALDYDSITGTYTITNGVVRTRDLAVAGRVLSGRVAGTYALASGVMNVDLTVRTSQRELRAKVTGTAAQPSIALAPGGLLTGSEKRKIEDELRGLLRKLR